MQGQLQPPPPQPPQPRPRDPLGPGTKSSQAGLQRPKGFSGEEDTAGEEKGRGCWSLSEGGPSPGLPFVTCVALGRPTALPLSGAVSLTCPKVRT